MLNYFSSIDRPPNAARWLSMWYWPYLFSEIYDVRLSATKTDFLPKNLSLKKRFVCQCGIGRIYFHWSDLFSLAKSIFTCRTYLVKYMVYVPVPQKWFFPKNPSEKRLYLSMWECPNLFSLVKSIFIGLIYFHLSNLYSEIYGLRPSATKMIFSEKSLWKKALFVNVGVAESIFTGQIYFHWPNLISLVESISWHIWCTSQCHKNWFFFRKILLRKKALFANVGVAESFFTDQIYFHWPKKALFVHMGVLLSIISIMWEFFLTKVVIKL